MKELDLLKKDWQKSDNSFVQVSENEIYKMIHKKSSSIVKWILIFSILEVLLWTFLGLFSNVNDYLKEINHLELILYFDIFNYLDYAVIIVFIYLFYKNYVLISTTTSTKKLMQDILKTRLTVQFYVWYNLGKAVLSCIIGFTIAFVYNPELDTIKEKIAENNSAMLITVGLLLLFCILLISLFWLFYRLVYGILLRRLFTNYKELKKIDL
jgi:ABC-type multidrug transport system fused ATPase/permease subunit